MFVHLILDNNASPDFGYLINQYFLESNFQKGYLQDLISN